MNTSTPDNNISDATAPSPVTTSTLGTTYSEESPSNSTQQGEQQATIEGPDQMELTGQDTPSWWHDDTQLRRPVSPSSLPHPPPPTAATTTPSTPRTILLSSIRGDDTNEPQPSSEAENELRRKILDIQKDSSIPAKDKARQIQVSKWSYPVVMIVSTFLMVTDWLTDSFYSLGSNSCGKVFEQHRRTKRHQPPRRHQNTL